MDRGRQALRSGKWPTRERIRMVAVAVLIASAAGFLYLVVTASGGVKAAGLCLAAIVATPYTLDYDMMVLAPAIAFLAAAGASIRQFHRE
jgi:hypothetical protein